MNSVATETPYLELIVVFLTMAVAVVSVVRRLHISPVVGYLLAGALMGPAGIGLITNVESVQVFGDFGVVFLLFTIGLDLSFARLRAMRHYVFGLGGLQVASCGGVLGVAAWLFGMADGAAFIIGAALAMSSTAMVMTLLRERGELASQTGRIALSMLLLQDLLVVPLLVMVPRLGGDGETTVVALAFALVKGVVALGVIMVLGRTVLAPLFRSIAAQRNAELLTGLTLLVVLGASWATESVGLSLALGAFLAGLLLAETEFRHQVEADIQPFRGILLGLFFMTVGMSMNLQVLLSDWPLVLGIVVAIMAAKTLAITIACRLFGFGTGFSLHQGLLLSQAGEFTFVLMALALGVGAVTREVGDLIVLATALTIGATPVTAWLGRRLQQRLERERATDRTRLLAESADLTDHIVIAAFGRVGQIAAQIISSHDLPYVAIDRDSGLVEAARAKGFPVYFGDASNRNMLRAAGVERARAAIVTLDNHEGAMRAVSLLRQSYPALPIVARGRDRVECDALRDAGATVTVLEAMESGLHLGGALLRVIGIDDLDAELSIKQFREKNYAALGITIPPGGARNGESPTGEHQA